MYAYVRYFKIEFILCQTATYFMQNFVMIHAFNLYIFVTCLEHCSLESKNMRIVVALKIFGDMNHNSYQ